MARRIIVVGGSLSGSTIAARIRNLDAQAEIILLEKGSAIIHAGTAWPGLLADDKLSPRDQHHRSAEEYQRQYRIDVRVNSVAVAIRRLRRLVEVRPAQELEGKPYKVKYDQLVLATGCVPVWPEVFPAGTEGVFTIKSPMDVLAIRAWLQKPDVSNVLIVGGTVAGLEAADALSRRGLSVTVLDKANHVLPSLDPDLARIVESNLRQRGIAFRLSRQVRQVSGNSGRLQIRLDDDSSLETDLVILACGSKPDISLAIAAGLKSGPFGTLQVSAGGQTEDKHVFAAGALVATQDLISGKPAWLPSYSSVIHQSRLVGDRICGRKVAERTGLGTMYLKLHGLDAGSVGCDENELLALRIACSRTYMIVPGKDGQPFLMVKILWSSQNRRLLGAQLVSSAPVADKLTTLALAIQAKQSVDDLAKADLPGCSTRPGRRNWLIQAGMMAQNQLDGLVRDFSIYDLSALDTSKATLVDVRSREDYLKGSIPGAINLPLPDLTATLNEGAINILPEKPVYVFSDTGRQGYLAARQLMLAGRTDVYNLAGGYWLYSRAIGRAAV